MAHRRCCCCLLINLLLINLYISWIKHVNKHLRSPIVYTRLLLLLLLFVLFSHLVCSFLYNVFSTCRTSKCLTSPIVCGPKLWEPVGPLLYTILYYVLYTILYHIIYTIYYTVLCTIYYTILYYILYKLWGLVGPWRDQSTIALHSCLHSQYIHKRRKIGTSPNTHVYIYVGTQVYFKAKEKTTSSRKGKWSQCQTEKKNNVKIKRSSVIVNHCWKQVRRFGKNQDGWQTSFLHSMSRVISKGQHSCQAFVVAFWREVAQMCSMWQIFWSSR